MLAGILPPIPGPEGLHPIVVHLPIGVLSVVPLLLLLGFSRKPFASGVRIAALLLMLAGTAGTFAAGKTGEMAEGRAEAVPAAKEVFHRHEEMAERTQLAFTGLSGAYLLLLAVPRLFKRDAPRFFGVLFLVLYVGGLLLLARTGHEGGRLVHEFGVRADFSASPAGGGHDDD